MTAPRRRFHGSKKTLGVGNRFDIHECDPDVGCGGRLHFYPLNDAEADALFQIIDAHMNAERHAP